MDNASMFPAPPEPQAQTVESEAVSFDEPKPPNAGQVSLLDAVAKATMEREVASVFQKIEAEKMRFEFHQRIAKLFIASGVFEDTKVANANQAIAQAMLKIELGAAAGLTPAESMKSIYFTPGGKPEIDSAVRAARMKRAGYDWRFLQHDDKGCSIELWRNGSPLKNSSGQVAIVSFTESDAKNAKVWNRKKGEMVSLIESNPTYKSYPRNMYFSRCITNAQRWYAPEALNGANFTDPTERDEIEAERDTVPRPLFPAREPAA